MWKDLFDKIFLFFVMFCWFGDEYNDINEGNIFVKLCFKCFYVYLYFKYEIIGVYNVKIKKNILFL